MSLRDLNLSPDKKYILKDFGTRKKTDLENETFKIAVPTKDARCFILRYTSYE